MPLLPLRLVVRKSVSGRRTVPFIRQRTSLIMTFARRTSLLATILAATVTSAAAQDGTRLLPQSHAKALAVEWRQDGRAVEVSVANPPGPWVVTSIVVEVRFKPFKVPLSGTLQRDKNGQMSVIPLDPKAPVEEYWVEQEAEKPTLRVEVQPAKAVRSHFEVKATSDISSIDVVEARGREQSTFERLRSKVF